VGKSLENIQLEDRVRYGRMTLRRTLGKSVVRIEKWMKLVEDCVLWRALVLEVLNLWIILP
jgi:hypothetical protein